MADYDVIVLGGGSPGEHCAGALAEGGLRVAASIFLDVLNVFFFFLSIFTNQEGA